MSTTIETNENIIPEPTKSNKEQTTPKVSQPTQSNRQPTPPKSKKFTLTQNKKQFTQLNKMEEYELLNAEGFAIKFYPEFSHDRIQDLLNELRTSLEYINKNEIEFAEEMYIDYVFFLCIKHFTHLKSGISNEFDKQLVQMKELVATGVYKEIIEDVFSQKEIKKVLDSLGDIIGNTMFLNTVENKAKEKLEQLELQNKDMLNVFSNKSASQLQ